jgi:hypothetical protein
MLAAHKKVIECTQCGESFEHYANKQGLYTHCDDCNQPDVDQYLGLTVYANKHERHLTIGKGAAIVNQIQHTMRRNFGVVTSMVERKN